MFKTRTILLSGFLVAAAAFFALDAYGMRIYAFPENKSLAALLGMIAVVGALYEASVLLTALRVRARKGATSEVQMIARLLGAGAIIVVCIVFLSYTGKLKGSWAAVAGFAGLLMGWSLQAPVSGLAAWVLVNLKRPFRVGDRVMLPAWGLIGDITEVGMMYTVMNQVGGTVGSEEAAGRYVLIPNAMLFGNVVINYTPQQSAAYVLDEVVVRITFNSNWAKAEKILLDAAGEVTGDIIQHTGIKPYIRADMYDYGVYLRLRYMTLATDRPRIVYEITKRIFDEFQKHPDVDFAIPYVFSHRTGLRVGGPRLSAPAESLQQQAEVEIDRIHDPSGVAALPENAAQVQELAKKIQELGLLQPIVVQQREDGQYNVVAGHLRLAACKALGWKTIPVTVRPGPP